MNSDWLYLLNPFLCWFTVTQCENIRIPEGEPVLMKIKTNHFCFESSVHIHLKKGIYFK